MPYADLELSLQRQGDSYAVELCFQPDPDAPVAHLLAGEPPRVRFDVGALLEHSLDAVAYGAGLTSLLFADARVREAFAKARAHAQAAKTHLRLRLRLDAADEALHTLRWETLCDLDGGGFLCTSERLLVTRYLDSADMSPLDICPRRELKALVVVANPAGLEKYPNLAPVDVAGEVARSQAALADIPTTVLARTAGGQPATLDAIIAALRDGPDILYLVAHGTQKDGESYLWLENEEGGIRRVSGSAFVEQIRNLANRPVLIVLASCQSAGTSHNAGALLALGPRLASAGIAAVVAMQGDVSMDTVAAFMPHFFRELRRDGQIDRALAAARGAQLERPDWWMPVLFLRVPNGMLWSAPPLDPPPPPERPPKVIDFVGREAELTAFAAKLANEHVAEITGMPGIGKTALASILAGRLVAPEKLFWHSFHSGEGVDALIWALAGFLATDGQAEVWEMLQRTQQDGGKPPPPDVLFDYLLQLLQGQGYLLCLDDFQFVYEDPQLDEFIKRLRPALQSGALTLIVTSRRMPAFTTFNAAEVLGGLSSTDTQLLLGARQLILPDALSAILYAQTGGNVQLLLLATDALRRTLSQERLVRDLIEADDIAHYLMHEVDDALSENERAVMQAMAVLLDYGGTRDEIEALLDGEGARRTLLDLHERYLLATNEGPMGREYRQHAIVQAFYYDELGQRKRETLHQRAGAYYETEERDALRAALHFECAGDDARAVDLAAADIWTLINSGQARTLLQLLDRLVARQVDPTDTRHLDADRWVAVNIACGEVYSRLRQSDLARERYQTAFALLTTQADAPAAREKRATVCRGMGELLEYESPQEALGWLRRGKDEAVGSGTLEEGILSLREGSVLIATGGFAAAREALEQSLRLLPEGAAMWRGKVQLNLGVIACIGGDLRRGKDHFLQAEALFTQAHDDWDLATVWQNLGRVQVLGGDWVGAGEVQQKALALAERLGNGTSQATFSKQYASRLYRNCRITQPGDGCATAGSGFVYVADWAPPASYSLAAAWADVDNDGDLDLAIGNGCESQASPDCFASQLYINTGSPLASTGTRPLEEISVAWGDVNRDGQLDLAIGGRNGVRTYLNNRGSLTLSQTLGIDSVTLYTETFSLAWGDVDGDGWLDLAAGNRSQPNQIYHNNHGTLQLAQTLSTTATNTFSLAWGDVDNDGDLDLVVGNDCPASACHNQLYRNVGGILTLDTSWNPAPTRKAPPWATPVGQAYRITSNAPSLSGVSISFGYLGSEVPPGEEAGLRVYFWNAVARQWERLLTSLNSAQNNASALTRGPGLYALIRWRVHQHR